MIRCPRCNSKEIYSVAGGYGGNYYRCKKCGYSGALVIEYDNDEVPEEKHKLQKEYREEVYEYEKKRRTLFWAILILLFIAANIVILYL